MESIPFRVVSCSPRAADLEDGKEISEIKNYTASERTVLHLKLIDSAPWVIRGVEIESLGGVSHIEVRGVRTSMELGPVLVTRTEVTDMFDHRSQVAVRRVGPAPPVATMTRAASTHMVSAVTDVEVFILSLWEPMVAPHIKRLTLFGASCAASPQPPLKVTLTEASYATGHVVAGAPQPTAGHVATAAPQPTTGHVAAAPPQPTTGHVAAPQPTTGHVAAAAPQPTAGHVAAAPPQPTTGHVAAPQPTTGHVAAPQPTTGHVAAAVPQPTTGHVAAAAPQDSKKPLDGVVICLSGYQHPLRGEIRDKALSLGAKVVNGWGPSSTHLICAVAGTPKYWEVVKSGHGTIVGKGWVEDCYLSRKRIAEDGYVLPLPTAQ